MSSAIGFNQEVQKKYFYDVKLKLFFNLGYRSGNYFPWINQMPLSEPNEQIIKEEIKLLKREVFRFIEISRANIKFDVLPPNTIKELVKLEYKEAEWKALFKEVQSFLIKNDIPIDETYLIE